MYANDTVIVTTNPYMDIVVYHSYEMFTRIREWCVLKRIRISVNKKKTKHMLIGTKTKETMWTRMDQDIATVENSVYLGVNLDNKFSFEKFINGTISRVNER